MGLFALFVGSRVRIGRSGSRSARIVSAGAVVANRHRNRAVMAPRDGAGKPVVGVRPAGGWLDVVGRRQVLGIAARGTGCRGVARMAGDMGPGYRSGRCTEMAGSRSAAMR